MSQSNHEVESRLLTERELNESEQELTFSGNKNCLNYKHV